MKTLNIQGSSDLPKVDFDSKKGKLFMGGSSLPENVFEFYNPIIKWLDKYKRNAKTATKVEFSFDYLNSASTNMMAKIISSLQDLKGTCENVDIVWYYCNGDYDMKELGSELLEDSICKYELVEIN
jgi:hypothetical protein